MKSARNHSAIRRRLRAAGSTHEANVFILMKLVSLSHDARRLSFAGCPFPRNGSLKQMMRITNGIIYWERVTFLGPFAVRCCGLLGPYPRQSHKGGCPSISSAMVTYLRQPGEVTFIVSDCKGQLSDMDLYCWTSPLVVSTVKA